jgi:hypothetical protein
LNPFRLCPFIVGCQKPSVERPTISSHLSSAAILLCHLDDPLWLGLFRFEAKPKLKHPSQIGAQRNAQVVAVPRDNYELSILKL